MAISAYTETTFQHYLHSVLGRDELGQSLDWSVDNHDYLDALDEALLILDETDITQFTSSEDLRKLRAVGRVEVWRSVMSRTAGDYDVKLQDGSDYKRSQLHAHASKMFDVATSEATMLGVNAGTVFEVGITKVIHASDHYRYVESS